MFLREIDDERTLTKVMDGLEARPGTSIRASNDDVSVHIGEDEKTLKIKEKEVPLTNSGMVALAAWLDIPKPFLLRIGRDLQQHLLNSLLLSTANEGIFRVSDLGLSEVYGPDQVVIEPRAMVERMIKVVDPIAPVVDFWSTPEDFRLDFTVPDGFDRGGIGGDRKVGDLTRGGWRLYQNRKQNHAPQVAEFYFRLVCTNGIEVEVEGERIDTRRQTVDQVLEEIELQAQRIMGRHEARIERFYALRDERVQKPEQALYRLADEQNISDRVVTELAKMVPTITGEGGDFTQFDLVNLVTNMANEPSIARRSGSRLILERAGGAVVHEHAERCTNCASRINLN